MGSNKPKDWSGQKIYFLHFIKPTSQKIGRSILWEAMCDCGNLAIVRPAAVANGHTKSCGCYHTQAIRKYSPMISTARHLWRGNYKELPFEKFLELSQQQCYYCNRMPFKTYNYSNTKKGVSWSSDFQKENGNFTYNGLDRLDSNKEHTEDNVVTCCYMCNTAKNNLSFDEFITHIERMYVATRRFREKK